MKIHILSGDSLFEPFKQTNIEGEILVCRECLVDGDLKADNLDDFWNIRENYLGNSSQKSDNFYKEKVKAEFEKLVANADGSEINLWFEYELFCQVNFWFCLSLLSQKDAEIYVVYPKLNDKKDIWKGFAFLSNEDLKASFENRIKLSKEDVLIGSKLWEAFQNKDFATLENLSQKESDAFPTLKEVGQAACEIETRPQKSLKRIIDNGVTEFGKAFQEFNEVEAIYGFGDLQVKNIYDYLQ